MGRFPTRFFLSHFLSYIFFLAFVNAQTALNLAAPLNITVPTAKQLETVNVWVRPPQFLPNGTQNFAPDVDPVQTTLSFYTVGHLAIADGDVIIGIRDEIYAAANAPPSKRSLHPRGHSLLVTDTKRKWPNAEFRYKFESQATKDKRGLSFNFALKFWKERLPDFKFIEEPISPDLQPNGGAVTLIDNTLTGEGECSSCSFSWVGRAINFLTGDFDASVNTMTLGPCADVSECTGVYAHEIGHSELPSAIDYHQLRSGVEK